MFGPFSKMLEGQKKWSIRWNEFQDQQQHQKVEQL